MNEKELISNLLAKHTGLKKIEILTLLEKPKYSNLGDISFPCFQLAKQQNKNPYNLALELKEKLKLLPEGIEKVDALGGYINFFLDKKILAVSIINKILKEKDKYGSQKSKGKKIVIDFSSPNIAKPMSIGHLRSTVIGNSLSKIFSFLGYKCIRINYLGDYGTQFGKLLVAYKKWGQDSKFDMEKYPIDTMLKLYNKFHIESENNPQLEEEARNEFKKLEEGDKENVNLWKKFRELSIKEFKKFYSILGVDFDVYSGESFYKDKALSIIKDMKKKNIAIESQGALIIPLDRYNLPPFLIQKSDSTTMYSSRDIAAAITRYNTYKFDKMLYVVASEQNTYFKQLFKTLELMGLNWAQNCHHINFGMIYMEKGKISTRKGNIIFLEDVLEKIFDLTRSMIKENFTKKEKEKIARAVGVSALIYSDLSNDRIKDIKFDWDKLLRLEGDSGPYIQYTYTRAKSILKKSKLKIKKLAGKDITNIILTEEEKSLVILLNEFPFIVENAAKHFTPHIIANYSLKVSDAFNSFYEKCPVIRAEKEKNLRVALTAATAYVLKNSMLLLGMIPLERM
ncbi:MAG: arginine--tRNA ligase [Candidatus Pacearchaeota archaeon]